MASCGLALKWRTLRDQQIPGGLTFEHGCFGSSAEHSLQQPGQLRETIAPALA
jgi:hypothetical protein